MAMTGGTAKLVKTGYKGGNTSYPIKLYVYYKTSQDVTNNRSTITLGMYFTQNSGSVGAWVKSSNSYLGTTSNTFNGAIPNTSAKTYWIKENVTMTVNHNADGTGKATIYWKWGVNSSWAQIQNPSGSFSINLPKINRNYTLTFNPNGGTLPNPGENLYMTTTNSAGHKNTGNSVTVTVNSGNYAAMVKDIPTKTGHSFKGWYTSTAGGTQVYNAAGNCTNEGTYWSGGVWKYNGNVTLYAQYTANNYTLTVNPNGGSWNGSTGSQSFTQAYGTTKTISNPTRTGYSFTNWSLSGYGSLSGTTYTYGAGAGTLTANWTPNTYTITYNANGGTGAPAAQNFVFNGGGTISTTKPTRTGYTFSHWVSNPNNKTFYPGGAIPKDWSSFTLVAQWVPKTIKISLDPNGGSGGTSAFYYKYGTSKFYSDSACTQQITSISIPTRIGHTFANYLGSGRHGSQADYGYIRENGTYFSSILATDIYENCTLYASWTANNYTLTFNSNGGSLKNPGGNLNNGTNTNSVTVTYGTSAYYGMGGDIPTRKGYSFTGWYTATSGGTKVYDSSGVCVEGTYWKSQLWSYAGNLTVYAQWTPLTYTISYNANGGSGTMSSHTVSYGSSIKIKDNEFTRAGYDFAGWTTKSDGSNDGHGWSQGSVPNVTGWSGTWAYVDGQYGIASGKLVLYARWQLKTYAISYNGNGNIVSGVPTAQTKTHGTNITLSSTKPTRTRYTFSKWNTKADGSGASYNPGATFSTNATTTLYAIWTLNDKNIYLYNTGKIDAVDFKTVSTVTELFDKNGYVYGTGFITHSESNIYIGKDGKIYAKEFIKY